MANIPQPPNHGVTPGIDFITHRGAGIFKGDIAEGPDLRNHRVMQFTGKPGPSPVKPSPTDSSPAPSPCFSCP